MDVRAVVSLSVLPLQTSGAREENMVHDVQISADLPVYLPPSFIKHRGKPTYYIVPT